MSRPEIARSTTTPNISNPIDSGATASAALADYIRRKYRSRHIDVVIAMTNDALQFVLEHRDELFPDAPIVFAGITVPDESVRRAGGGIAVVRVGSAYVETLKLALQLHPSTERVFVMAQSPNQQNVDSVRAQLSEFSRQVQLTFVDEETMPRVLEVIRAVAASKHRPPHLAAGERAERHARIRWESRDSWPQAAPVPVYGTVDLNIGTGIVGGVVRGTRETGTRVGADGAADSRGHASSGHSGRGRTARPDLRLAPDQAMGHRPVAAATGIATSDSSRRPRGNPIVPYIIATIIVVAAQLLAIAGLLVQRARRRRAEETVVAREATIRTSYERIRQLAGRLINAQEAARASIARDLHDGVCQELAGVSIAVGSLKNSSGSDSGRARAAGVVEDPERDARHVRRDSASLARPAPGDACAWSAWRRPCGRTASKSRSGMRCDVHIHGGRRLRRPPPRCRRVFLSNCSGVASKRRRARRRATALGLARPIRRAGRADRDRRRPRIRPRGGAPERRRPRTREHRGAGARDRRRRGDRHRARGREPRSCSSSGRLST